MSFAVRSDGLGWRAVSGPDACAEGEVWQAECPPLAEHEPPPTIPTIDKIKAWLAANPDVVAEIEEGTNG